MLSALQQAAVAHKTVADAAALIACAVCLAVAVRTRARTWAPALSLALGGMIAALAMSTDDCLHRWDEQFHALVATHLVAHPLEPTLYEKVLLPASGYWDSTHTWLFHPPFPLWVIASSLSVFGQSELAVRLPSVLFHGAATVAVFALGRRLFSQPVGFVGAALFAFNGRLLELASGRAVGDHPDSIFTSLVAIAVALMVVQLDLPQRWRPPVIGALVGCAILTKWLPALLVFGLWGFLLLRRGQLRARWPELLAGLAGVAAVALSWELFAISRYPEAHAQFLASNRAHVLSALDDHLGGPLYHLVRVPRVYGEAGVVAIAWFLWTQAVKAKSAAAQLLGLWFVVPYFFWAFVSTKMENHVMFCSPALCLMVAFALVAAIDSVRRLSGWRRAGLAALALAWAVLPLRFAVERWKPFQLDEHERALAASLRELPKASVAKLAVFAPECRCAAAAMFYSGQLAYPFEPSADQLAAVEAQGYSVLRYREK